MHPRTQLTVSLAVIFAITACTTDSINPLPEDGPGKTTGASQSAHKPAPIVVPAEQRPMSIKRTDADEKQISAPGRQEAEPTLADRRVAEGEVKIEESDSLRRRIAHLSQDKIGKEKVARADVAREQFSSAQELVAPSSGVAANLNAIRAPSEPLNRENYAHFEDNQLKQVSEQPVSTFSIDVDTGAYSNARRVLNAGGLPVKDAVRVEEFINYFAYDYPAPTNRATPFNVVTELGPNPWNATTQLLHIGIKGYEVPKSQIPAANLVFLVDVSGSMRSENKLGLLKTSLKMLTQQMRQQDRVSIVVYAGASGVVLEPVAGNNKVAITAALDSLSAGGSTNGGAGIRLAYAMAEQAFVEGGINRVMLATDGDFNVGTTNFEALKDLVEEKRKTGVSLTTLGFGAGNYNDHLMEQLADAGNGNYAYIDTLNEARKVLVEQMSATLQTIAKDVKIQIEFNPNVVSEYRLIGYENRVLAREDFNNDQIDAGEIGAGHTVTAVYEIALVGSNGQRADPLRYQNDDRVSKSTANELAFLRLRYKAPDGDTSKLIERPLAKTTAKPDLADTSDRFRFAAAVAGFGQLLRGGTYMEEFSYDDVKALASGARGGDPFGYRGEFVTLVNLAQTLSGQSTAQVSQ